MPEKNQGKPSQEELDALLKIASQKLGTTPEKLRVVISNPQTADELLKKIGGSDLKAAASSPEALERLVRANPKARQLLDSILGDKKGEK